MKSNRRFFIEVIAVLLVVAMVFALSACTPWQNPCDKLGGGKEGQVADTVDSSDV